VVTFPDFAGTVSDFNNVSVSVSPLKFEVASMLYPQVFIESGAGDEFSEAGRVAPRLVILVLLSARTYNLNPDTSVEVTVTLFVPVARVPEVVGVIGIETLPEVDIESEV